MEIKVFASGSSGNCYWISDGKNPLLLDGGIPLGIIKRALSFKLSEIDGCLVTHEHSDHSKAVNDLQKASIDCYMSQGTKDALGVSGHRVHVVRAKEQFSIGTWSVLPFDAVHDSAEPLSFLLASSTGKKLLYATDTAYLRYRFRGLTHLMIEANYSLELLRDNPDMPAEIQNRIVKNHMSIETVKGFLKANDLSKVEEIWLLHLSAGNSDAKMFKKEIMALTGKPVCVAGEKS
jgi:phosphoribosyl 1,2-cyclic phosphodiesterase